MEFLTSLHFAPSLKVAPRCSLAFREVLRARKQVTDWMRQHHRHSAPTALWLSGSRSITHSSRLSCGTGREAFSLCLCQRRLNLPLKKLIILISSRPGRLATHIPMSVLIWTRPSSGLCKRILHPIDYSIAKYKPVNQLTKYISQARNSIRKWCKK